MKNIFLLLLVSFFLMPCAFAQRKIKSSEVTEAAIKTVDSKFSSYKKVIWRKIDTLYEAEVRKGKYYSYVTVQRNGKWIETMSEINVSELPPKVTEGLHSLYSSAKVKAAAMVERASEETKWMIEFRFKGKRGVATLDKNGK